VKNAERLDPTETEGSAACDFLFTDLQILCIGLDFERQAHSEGFRFIAGVDEVGRGCLAGPVVAAACILDLDKVLPENIDDSKKLTPQVREEIAHQLKAECVAYAIGQVEADEIDRINILEATKKAMLLAIEALQPALEFGDPLSLGRQLRLALLRCVQDGVGEFGTDGVSQFGQPAAGQRHVHIGGQPQAQTELRVVLEQ